MVSFSHLKKWRTASDPQADNTQFLFGAILYQVAVVFNGNRSFFYSMNFASYISHVVGVEGLPDSATLRLLAFADSCIIGMNFSSLALT